MKQRQKKKKEEFKPIVGTSGWMYKHWGEKFYPKGLKDIEKLPYLATHFDTVEINATFYRLPTAKVFKNWKKKAAERFPNFIYTVKFSKFITHNKKLVLDKEAKSWIREFVKRCRELGEYSGALLIQLPPSLRFDTKLLTKFFDFLLPYMKRMKYNADVAIEFRHKTWMNTETYKLLRKYKVAFVCADSSRWAKARAITASFGYVRLHGPTKIFASSYSHEQLDEWRDYIYSKKRLKKCYVYFNNDNSAYAIDNAKYMKKIMEKKA